VRGSLENHICEDYAVGPSVYVGRGGPSSSALRNRNKTQIEPTGHICPNHGEQPLENDAHHITLTRLVLIAHSNYAKPPNHKF
jgi:hypothetical protein